MSRILGIAGLLLGALLSGPILALGALAGAGTDRVSLLLVVAPPWIALDAVIAAADVRSVSPRPAPLAQLVARDPSTHDVEAALRSAGAMLVLDGTALARICGVET